MENKEQENETKALVKIKVIMTFRDKFDKSVLYEPGTELEFEPNRAEDVVSRNLAEYIDPLG